MCRRNFILLFFRSLTSNVVGVCKVGDEAEIRRVFHVKDVQSLAHFSGDTNPIHIDGDIAKKTHFGRLVIHGVLLDW